MKFLPVIITLWGLFDLTAQSITKIEFANKSIQISDVAALSYPNSIGIKNSPKLAAINVSDESVDLRKVALMSIVDSENFSGYLLSHNGGHLSVKTVKLLNDTEALLLGSFEGAGSVPLMFLAKFDLRIKTISDCRLITLSNDPSFLLSPVDVLVERDEYYILAETYVDYLSSQNSKVVVLKTKGLDIEWGYSYNTVAPVHSESASSIAFSPLGNLIVGGIITTAGDNFPRMMLMELTKEGIPVKFKKVELYAPMLAYSNRYGWTFVKSLGANIHLFSQSVVGRSEPGQVLVTMFDVNLDLRTWRNYTVPIRVETSMIEPGLFYFGGQAPVENGLNGYTMMKVNSSNAIVEALRNFKTGINNVSAATSSSSCFESNTRSLWTLAKPNGGGSDHLVLFHNNLLLESKCAEDFTSAVYKDTMRITNLNLNEKSLIFESNSLDCKTEEINFRQESLCEPTDVEHIEGEQLELFLNDNKEINVKSNLGIKSIMLYGIQGKAFELQKKNEFLYKVKDENYTGLGIVFIQLNSGLLVSRKIFIH